MRIPTDNPAPTPAKPQHYTTDLACWRNYVTDLIYAAATSPASYAREIAKRKPGVSMSAAMRSGEAMGAALRSAFPDARGCLSLARSATGDDQPISTQRRERFFATVAICSAWLPPRPATSGQLDAAERARRSGITEAQRQANATALAEAF